MEFSSDNEIRRSRDREGAGGDARTAPRSLTVAAPTTDTPEDSPMTQTTTHAEKLEFKTELKQLLHIITHSLYSNKEIFLRELICNASDAINKLKFDSLQHEDKLEGDKDWKIKIAVDKEKNALTVSDNGIGMSRDLAVENLGTIAKSGTRAFLESLQSKGAAGADRPVRRRLLLRLHGRGQGDGGFAAGRRPSRPGRALGVGRPGRFHRRDRAQGPPRHGRDPAPQGGRKGVSGPV